MHQLETLLEATVDRNFDKFEIYTLRNLLTVPDGLEKWMRLAHYRVCLSYTSFSFSEEGDDVYREKVIEDVG